MQEAMKVAAEDVIASEPDLTRWDTVRILIHHYLDLRFSILAKWATLGTMS